MDIILESLLSTNRPINAIADYEFGRNIKAYLKQKTALKGRGMLESHLS